MMKNKYLKVTLVFVIAIASYSFQDKFFEVAKHIEIYNTLFKELNKYYYNEISPAEFTNKAIKNTLQNLDPYTNYYNAQDVEDARIRREGEYGGIGVSVFYSKQGITISEIYKEYPADKAGLKVGDLITEVNGQSLKGLERDQLSMQLKGNPKKPLNLKVNRLGKTVDFNLALDKITVNPVPFFDMINEDTGYIVLTRFNAKASKEVKKAFKSLKDKGMKKLVFDLRSNPGGSLFESINISNFFLPKGSLIVTTKGKIKKMTKTYKGNKEPLDLEIPIVVLINGRSASASEIVSGSLQDYDRAVVLGERSFGKGLVQRYFPLTYGTQAKITISKYYTPSGRCIQELDYANRDSKTNKVPKFSDGIVNSFTTTNGRKVFDGGGVMPDVKINRTQQNDNTKGLLRSRAIFNFATNYVAKNSSINIENFKMSNSDFQDFQEYLKKTDTAFTIKQERLFKKAFLATDKNQKITREYQQIISKIKEEKVVSVTENKDVIVERIEDEVLKRFFYKKGVYQYHLKNDKTIKQASELLSNSKKYRQILEKK
ncbi:S41 family peptidase [Lutibacter sp. Hel_I_33_5]|uniref:S41 family peptidase n=1 Tax=Lutibacter sp. Hel_I_33_5 TaxID=1566289 RepID=UPI0021084680|nr:S41 family peptidase [Lutibacter sp. Hel_I_33_5]